MKTCVYFADILEPPLEDPLLPGLGGWFALGWGFTPEGRWRPRPLPAGAAGLVVDDRHLPSPAGLREAERALARWEGAVILDLERPGSPLLVRLAEILGDRDLVLPPHYAACPHSRILAGPWTGEGDFPRWLARQEARYGPLVLDGAPVSRLLAPGRPGVPWTGPLPEGGFPDPAGGCLHRRRGDGSLLLWDSPGTLARRLKGLEVPVLLLREEWAGIQKDT